MYMTGLGMVVVSLSLLIFVGIITFILFQKKKSTKGLSTEIEKDSLIIIGDEGTQEQDNT